MSKYEYDMIVIGVGSGGISATFLSHGLGKKTAVVEKRRIGGECTWTGCVPSKALIKAAETAYEINNMSRVGLSSEYLKLNTDGVMQHVRDIIQRVYRDESPDVFEKMGIDVFIGSPIFVDAHQITVGEKTLTSGKFVIATGSSPAVPNIPGLENIDYLTNENLFELENVPESMIVVGGGPIGLEMAQAFQRLGSKITVVQRSSILKKEDKELAEMLRQRLIEEGLTIYTDTPSQSVGKSENGVKLMAGNEKGPFAIEAEQLLIATGRKPNVRGMQLENAGIVYSEKGIVVDKTLRTTAKNIYAVGDVINQYLFSHMAEYQATLAVQNALLPLPPKKVNYSMVPWSTFTDPELAHAGLTEEEARAKWGDRVRIHKFPYEHVDRAKTDLAEFGLGKFIFSPKGKLAGIHILGNRASELLHEAQLTHVLKKSFGKIKDMVHIYPTYGDLVKRPSARFYVEQLQNMWLVKLVKKLAWK